MSNDGWWFERYTTGLMFKKGDLVETSFGICEVDGMVKIRPSNDGWKEVTRDQIPHGEGDWWNIRIITQEGKFTACEQKDLKLHIPNSKKFITD